MDWKDLAEHVGMLVVLLGLFSGLCGFFFWRLITRLEKKLDEIGLWIMKFIEKCAVCKGEQDGKFVHQKDFDENWRPGRNAPGGLWEAINNHSHEGISGSGRVVRTKK